MASSGGTSYGSGSTGIQEVMDLRKKKRMLSNRESARRSRQRKQKHLDELTAQLSQLRKENGQIVAALNITTQHYLGVEAESSVLRTQMMELSRRLRYLNEILTCMSEGSSAGGYQGFAYDHDHDDDDEGRMMMRPWSLMEVSSQLPIMASVDMYQYC